MPSAFVSRAFAIALLVIGSMGTDVRSAAARAETDADAKASEPTPAPPARTEYKGRRIAHTMHWLGGEWLLRDTREDEEHTGTVVEQLQLKPGMTVCDLGCGNGYYTLLLAEQVKGKDKAGNAGQVIGVEIQKQYFPILRKRAKEAGLDNIKLQLGLLHDPLLEEASCDVILIVDVYHEFSHPEWMLKNMRKALKPNGMIVLLEFRMEDEAVPIKLLHKMSKQQIMNEVPPNGYKLVREYDGLPWQHMMFFARDDSELDAIEPNENWRPIMEKAVKESKERKKATESPAIEPSRDLR